MHQCFAVFWASHIACQSCSMLQCYYTVIMLSCGTCELLSRRTCVFYVGSAPEMSVHACQCKVRAFMIMTTTTLTITTTTTRVHRNDDKHNDNDEKLSCRSETARCCRHTIYYCFHTSVWLKFLARLRSASTTNYSVPRTRTKFGDRAFFVAGPVVYMEQFVKQTACIRSSVSSKLICSLYVLMADSLFYVFYKVL